MQLVPIITKFLVWQLATDTTKLEDFGSKRYQTGVQYLNASLFMLQKGCPTTLLPIKKKIELLFVGTCEKSSYPKPLDYTLLNPT